MLNPICKNPYYLCKLPSDEAACKSPLSLLATQQSYRKDLAPSWLSHEPCIKVRWGRGKHLGQTFHTGSHPHGTKLWQDLWSVGCTSSLPQEAPSEQDLMRNNSRVWGKRGFMPVARQLLHCSKGQTSHPHWSEMQCEAVNTPGGTCMTLVYLSTRCHMSGALYVHFELS